MLKNKFFEIINSNLKYLHYFSEILFKKKLINIPLIYNIRNKIINLEKNSSYELKLDFLLKKGWYLLGIKHTDSNLNCSIHLRINGYHYIQKRRILPNKYRWRIIHIPKSRSIKITFIDIDDHININDLWIIRIPFLEAYRRIYLKIYDTLILKKLKNFSLLWRTYNKSFCDHNTSYQYWINHIEPLKFNNYNKSNLAKYNYEINYVSFSLNKIKYPKNHFVILKEEDVILSQESIKFFNNILVNHKDCNILYTDEDFIEGNIRTNPNFKPDWNREMFITNPNFGSMWVIRSDLVNNAISILMKFEFEINPFNIVLEVTSLLENRKESGTICHLPLVLAHKNSKKYSLRKASRNNLYYLNNHISRYKKLFGNLQNILFAKDCIGYIYEWEIPKKTLLSILIPTKDKLSYLLKCIDSIYKYKIDFDVEIIIIDNGSKEDDSLNYLNSINNKVINKIFHKVIKEDGEFNFSYLINSGARKAKGNVLLLLNNDIEIIKENWANYLVSNALRPSIGCVGAKLVYDDLNIQHAGIILGIGGYAGHSHKYLSSKLDGYQNRLILQHEVSAVTGALLAVSRENFFKLGGLDEMNFKVNYNDVDFCLRAFENHGLRNLYIPEVLAIHHESKSRGYPIGNAYKQFINEKKQLKRKWSKLLKNDPHYNPNLTKVYENFDLMR